jgi:hypothetical protein
MSTTRVHAARVTSPRAETLPGDDVLDVDLKRARKLATFLDARFSLFGIRFGFDGIFGLVPVVGDAIPAVLGAYLLYLAWKHDFGKRVMLLVTLNILFDYLVGCIPGIGDAADIFFRGHIRNLDLLERTAAFRRGQPPPQPPPQSAT